MPWGRAAGWCNSVPRHLCFEANCLGPSLAKGGSDARAFRPWRGRHRGIGSMLRWHSAVGLTGVLTMALATAYCGDSVGPTRRNAGTAVLSGAGSSAIVLDQVNGILNDATPYGDGQTHVGKGFEPTN